MGADRMLLTDSCLLKLIGTANSSSTENEGAGSKAVVVAKSVSTFVARM